MFYYTWPLHTPCLLYAECGPEDHMTSLHKFYLGSSSQFHNLCCKHCRNSIRSILWFSQDSVEKISIGDFGRKHYQQCSPRSNQQYSWLVHTLQAVVSLDWIIKNSTKYKCSFFTSVLRAASHPKWNDSSHLIIPNQGTQLISNLLN